jgi:SAM-dependent methyltransferase
MGGLYPTPDVVRSILAPREGETQKILDLGLSHICPLAKRISWRMDLQDVAQAFGTRFVNPLINGSWWFSHPRASEIAKEFPHCEVVGVDLAPVPLEKMDLPPNCRFEIDDVNNGLAHFRDQFDVVHVRFIASGIKDFRKTMQAIEECLKPGGIVLWVDGDYDVYTGDQYVYIPFATAEDASGSWFQRIIYG